LAGVEENRYGPEPLLRVKQTEKKGKQPPVGGKGVNGFNKKSNWAKEIKQGRETPERDHYERVSERGKKVVGFGAQQKPEKTTWCKEGNGGEKVRSALPKRDRKKIQKSLEKWERGKGGQETP